MYIYQIYTFTTYHLPEEIPGESKKVFSVVWGYTAVEFEPFHTDIESGWLHPFLFILLED